MLYVFIIDLLFVFVIVSVYRVDDIYRFLCSHHPRLKDADGDDPPEPKMVNGRLEIINIKGSFSDVSETMTQVCYNYFLRSLSFSLIH